MFDDQDLAFGYVPQLLALLPESPGGVVLDDLPAMVKGRLKGKLPAPSTFDRTLERSILITIVFGLAEIKLNGGAKIYGWKAHPSEPPAAATRQDVTIDVNPPARAASASATIPPDGGSPGATAPTPPPATPTANSPRAILADYHRAIKDELADGRPKALADLRKGVKGRLDPDAFVESTFLANLGVMEENGEIEQDPPEVYALQSAKPRATPRNPRNRKR